MSARSGVTLSGMCKTVCSVGQFLQRFRNLPSAAPKRLRTGLLCVGSAGILVIRTWTAPWLLEMHLFTVVDLEQVVCEHLVTFYRILRSSPTTKEEVAKAWPLVKSRLQASPHPWKVVSGLGWSAPFFNQWTVEDSKFELGPDDPCVGPSAEQSKSSAFNKFIHTKIHSKGGKWQTFFQSIWQGGLVQSGNGGLPRALTVGALTILTTCCGDAPVGTMSLSFPRRCSPWPLSFQRRVSGKGP